MNGNNSIQMSNWEKVLRLLGVVFTGWVALCITILFLFFTYQIHRTGSLSVKFSMMGPAMFYPIVMAILLPISVGVQYVLFVKFKRIGVQLLLTLLFAFVATYGANDGRFNDIDGLLLIFLGIMVPQLVIILMIKHYYWNQHRLL